MSTTTANSVFHTTSVPARRLVQTSAAHPVPSGHLIRPVEVDDVGSHGGRDGRQRGDALQRAGRSPAGRPGGALERAPQGGGGPAVAAGRGPGRPGARDRPTGGGGQRVAGGGSGRRPRGPEVAVAPGGGPSPGRGAA